MGLLEIGGGLNLGVELPNPRGVWLSVCDESGLADSGFDSVLYERELALERLNLDAALDPSVRNFCSNFVPFGWATPGPVFLPDLRRGLGLFCRVSAPGDDVDCTDDRGFDAGSATAR